MPSPSRPVLALVALAAAGVLATGLGLVLLVPWGGPDRLSALLPGTPGPEPAPERGGLGAPASADTWVLCYAPFEGPATQRSDCGVLSDVGVPADLQAALARAERVPQPAAVCAIGAGSFTLAWLDGGRIAGRVEIPDASCLLARDVGGADPGDPEADDEAYTVSDALLGELRALHASTARAGGAFDPLADPDPPAAACVRRYPDQLAQMPLALDVVVLAVAPTDPAATPESPGVPFTDVEVLVLDTFAGHADPRHVLRALGEPPDPATAVGERLLAANTSPFLSACGFTQPYSRQTARQWQDAFAGQD